MPQGTGRQRAATAGTDLQRERILQAAATLFASQGYAATTLAQIVRALDVTKPFVYYYFRDKQEIFETLSWRPAVDCFTALDFAPDDDRRAVDKVKAGIEGLIRATVAHHPCAFFAYREPKKAKSLHMGVIPRAVDEYWQFRGNYAGQELKEQLGNPVHHVHDGKLPVGELPVTFGLLLNLVGVLGGDATAEQVWAYLARYIPDATPAAHPELTHWVRR